MRARWAVIGVTWLGLSAGTLAAAEEGDNKPDGRELFFREWKPNDPRSRGGDGLGPVFNANSCFACHAQGSAGGGGANERNVDMVSILRDSRLVSPPRGMDQERIVPRALEETTQERQARFETREKARQMEQAIAELIPGLNGASSLVVHKFAVDPGFDRWRTESMSMPTTEASRVDDRVDNGDDDRQTSQTQMRSCNRGPASRANIHARPGFRLVNSARSTPALFGSGKIDGISDATLQSAAARVFSDFPEIRGRLARTSTGKIGRFGWKGQTESLREFVLAACSNELGLEVPEHPQAADPRLAEPAIARGLDLSAEDCDALIGFVGRLPEPVVLRPESSREKSLVETGRSVFASIGCASCHVPDLGSVKGLYSDLLLHDLGNGLQAGGGGYGERSSPSSPSRPSSSSIASEQEWRTPPLWGLADSAPFLHDGRAGNLEAAILGHGGEASATAKRYLQLERSRKLALREFLGTLRAPEVE